MKMNKLFFIGFVFVIIIQGSFALEWAEGSLHQHTGYSTFEGYDGHFYTDEDNCPLYLEGDYLLY